MRNVFLLLAGVVLFMSSCVNSNNDTADLSLNFEGLENLGDDYAYEGWLLVDGSPVTTGVFTVNDNGVLSSSTFEVNADDLEDATSFILTIEPSPDNDPAPSATHVVAGDFDGSSASLALDHDGALGTDFSDAAGKFIIATPSDGNGDIDEESGVWFLDNSSGAPATGLSLPTLADGWKYEGWAVIDGTPVSTGTFLTNDGSDDSGIYSGSAGSPPYPGEDFLMNAPAGLDFPVSLLGQTIVISVEPSPDNSEAPFRLKPLATMVDAGQATHSAIDLGNNIVATSISGSATR